MHADCSSTQRLTGTICHFAASTVEGMKPLPTFAATGLSARSKSRHGYIQLGVQDVAGKAKPAAVPSRESCAIRAQRHTALMTTLRNYGRSPQALFDILHWIEPAHYFTARRRGIGPFGGRMMEVG